MKPVHIVAVLELLALLLIAGAAGVAAWTYVGLWAGLLAAGIVLAAGAWLIERNATSSRDPGPRP